MTVPWLTFFSVIIPWNNVKFSVSRYFKDHDNWGHGNQGLTVVHKLCINLLLYTLYLLLVWKKISDFTSKIRRCRRLGIWIIFKLMCCTNYLFTQTRYLFSWIVSWSNWFLQRFGIAITSTAILKNFWDFYF